jgi:hypothetical protein
VTERDLGWIAVRTVIGTPWEEGQRCYEERITLWRSHSYEDAFRRAAADAASYVAQWDPPAEVLSLQQGFQLFDAPGDGTEVFSLIRDSDMQPEDYLDRHFDTGKERQGTLK